jgi:hypothetical protein
MLTSVKASPRDNETLYKSRGEEDGAGRAIEIRHVGEDLAELFLEFRKNVIHLFCCSVA